MSDFQQVITGVFHELASSKLTLSFVLCSIIFLIFLNRRASVAYVWRSLHLIEDLVLEKEFLSKIDLPLKSLLLTLLFTPLIGYLPAPFSAYLTQFALFLIPLLAIHVVIQGFDLIVFRWYFEKHKEANLPAVFRAIIITMLYVVVVLVLLQSVYNLNILPVIATSTVMTAVLGLAMQDTLKNLFAGLTISLEKRFKQGDWITLRLDAAVLTTGEISEIGWRTIRIRTLDDNYAVIPNATFTNSNITNHSRPVPSFVRNLEIPVPVSASIDVVSRILLTAASSVEGVVAVPAPIVTPLSVKLDQVNLRLRFWIENFPKGDEICGEVIEKCFDQLQFEKIISTQETLKVVSIAPNQNKAPTAGGKPAGTPIGATAAMPGKDPAATPIGELVVKQVGDPAAKQVGDPAARPIADPAAKQIGDPAAKQIGDPAPQFPEGK